jgi:hypothetical protein
VWNETTEDRELIRELTRDVVAEVAPRELKHFDRLINDYFDNPYDAIVRGAPDDSPLGLGLTDPIFLSALLASALNVGLTFIFEIFRDAAKDELTTTLKESLRRLFGHSKAKLDDSLNFQSDTTGTPDVIVIGMDLTNGPAYARVPIRSLESTIYAAMRDRGLSERKAQELSRVVAARLTRHEPKH